MRMYNFKAKITCREVSTGVYEVEGDIEADSPAAAYAKVSKGQWDGDSLSHKELERFDYELLDDVEVSEIEIVGDLLGYNKE